MGLRLQTHRQVGSSTSYLEGKSTLKMRAQVPRPLVVSCKALHFTSHYPGKRLAIMRPSARRQAIEGTICLSTSSNPLMYPGNAFQLGFASTGLMRRKKWRNSRTTGANLAQPTPAYVRAQVKYSEAV